MSDDILLDDRDETAVLSEAEHLVRDGEPLRAIDVLTAANRSHPSPVVEDRLLQVRTQAFEQIDRTPGRAAWPRHCPDPFPEVHGVPPEINRRDLDADIVAGAIEHHGSLIVREMVTQEEVELLRDAIRNSFEARQAFAESDEPEETAWYAPFAKGRHHEAFGSERFVRIIDSPRTLFRLLDVYERNGMIDIITEHLGERPALSAHKCALRKLTPNPDERSSDYHQDGSFLGAGIRTVNVWLPLTDCGGPASTAAGLDVIPTRIDHILETGVEGAWFDWTISETTVARAAEGTPVVRPVFAAGDAMLFDEVMVHRTGLSAGMVDERMAIESWFFAPSRYPDDHVPILV